MNPKEVYTETEKISKIADSCFMSHQLFAVREIIAQKLDGNFTIKEKFKEKIREIYKVIDDSAQHEAYIDLELTPIYNGDDEEYRKKESTARVYVSVDKVDSILNNKNSEPSYALRLMIAFSGTDAEPPYNGGYIDKKCSRFVISHELGHSILHLSSLIEKAVDSNKSAVLNNNDKNQHEEEANVFADVLSDLRDVHLLGKGYTFDIKKIRKHGLNANKLEKIYEEASAVNKRAEEFTMSHAAFAVSDIINKKLRKERSKEIINIYMTANNNEHIEDKVIVNCYKRKQKENFYIFELRLNNQENKRPKYSSIEIEVCKAIGCVYFYFPQMKEMIDKEDGKNECRPIPKNVSNILDAIGMKKDKDFIKMFAKDIYKKRQESLETKTKHMKENKDVRSRLKNNNR
jgi:hypothetical protein